MSKIISLSTMQEIKPAVCVLGQMIRYSGDMANPSGVGAIVSVNAAGPFNRYQSYDVALTDGRLLKGLWLDQPNRYEVTDEIASPEVLDVLRAGVAAKLATDKARDTAAKEDFANTVAKLRADYPHLEQIAPGAYGSAALAAKNIRTELKRAFPGVKFGVRSKTYSGGDSITVSWTDGPTRETVEKMVGKYAGGSFDGMSDCYDYKRSPWTEVFGDAKYVFCSRDYSDAVLASVITRVCEYLGGMESVPTVEDYRQGNLWKFKQSGGCDVEHNIRTALAEYAQG